MKIHGLELRNFRNYETLRLNFSKQIVLITGKNGAGKTSILESLCLLGSGRSFRIGKNIDFVRRTAPFAQVQARISNSSLENDLSLQIFPNGKKIFVDGKQIRSNRGLAKILPAIVFTPGDHSIAEGDSSERRNFLQRAMMVWDPSSIDLMTSFSRALLQRNRILKTAQSEAWSLSRTEEELIPWTDSFLNYSVQLLELRRTYLESFAPWAQQEYSRIAQTQETFGVSYQALGEETALVWKDRPELAEKIRKTVSDSLRQDYYSGSTQRGPHRDEILLTLNGNKVRFYASQGEKRTCALALRLGELALFRAQWGRMPVLLFDDVSSELDRARRQSLVELLQGENTQVFITATEPPAQLLEVLGMDLNGGVEQLNLDALRESSSWPPREVSIQP
jgi:DNA replication and repair protein RecF